MRVVVSVAGGLNFLLPPPGVAVLNRYRVLEIPEPRSSHRTPVARLNRIGRDMGRLVGVRTHASHADEPHWVPALQEQGQRGRTQLHLPSIDLGRGRPSPLHRKDINVSFAYFTHNRLRSTATPTARTVPSAPSPAPMRPAA